MLLRYEVISLQGICTKAVAANPEVHSEGAVDFLPPLFDDFLTVIIEAQCPMFHCQLIIVGFSLYLHDFHAIIQKLLDYVLQAEKGVSAPPDVVAGEIVHVVFFESRGGVQIEPSSRLKASPYPFAELSIIGNMLDNPIDNHGVVGLFRVMVEKILENYGTIIELHALN